MNMIIDLIIKIFEAVFEKDAARRRRAQAEPPPPRVQTKGGAPAARPQSRTLENWLEELFQEDLGPPPRPAQPEPATARSFPSPGPVGPMEEHEETLGEHLHKTEERIHRQERRIREQERQLLAHMGKRDEHYSLDGQKVRMTLPGSTTLEKLIYANVILGPCKGRRHSRRLNQP